jgi:hypothetical protein
MPAPTNAPEHSTRLAAEQLAERLRLYWGARGLTIETRIFEMFTRDRKGRLYAVRSNLSEILDGRKR